MRDVIAFVDAISKHWWALMSSAIFTFLGIFVAITGEIPQWTVYSSFAAAVLLILVSAYKAWKDERNRYLAQLSKNSRPEIRGEYFNESRIHKESGETIFWFHLALCNQRPQPTTVKHVVLTLTGTPVLNHKPQELFMSLQPDGSDVRLERGIEAVIQCTASVPTSDAMFLARMRVRLADALGNEYDIPRRVNPAASTRDQQSPTPSQE